MKKIFFVTVLLFATAVSAMADNLYDQLVYQTYASMGDSTNKPRGAWTTSSTPALKVDGHYYNNWQATGISQVSFISTFNGNYKYTHDKFTWDNVVDLALGLYWQDLDGDTTQHGFAALESRRKNDDKIDLTSTFSMKLKNAWNVNASANFKSQFFPGYKYSTTDTLLISSFMAPAYLTTSIGFECKKEFWNLSLSFLTGKTTFLLDEYVIAAGQLYGVDTTGGRRIYAGLGSYVKFYYKKDIAKNLNFYTRIELFYDYRKPHFRDINTQSLIDGLGEGEVFEADYNTWPVDMVNGGLPTGFFPRTGYTLFHDTDIDFEFKLEYRFSNFFAAYMMARLKYDSDFNQMSTLIPNTYWQLYQSAGVQVYFNWKTPTEKPRERHHWFRQWLPSL